MRNSRLRLLLTAASAVAVMTGSACAAGPTASPAPSSTAVPALGATMPPAPDGRLIGTGMVLDTNGEVQFCLGAIKESYPPQCAGIPLDGWSWEGLDGSETSAGTTWGQYAVYGTYDGKRYTVIDEPIMLALYDPIRPDDPTGGVDGTLADAELTRIQEEIGARLGNDALSVWAERGYVWLQVVWDDGTLQDAADAEYGEDRVVVISALRASD